MCCLEYNVIKVCSTTNTLKKPNDLIETHVMENDKSDAFGYSIPNVLLTAFMYLFMALLVIPVFILPT